MKEVRELEVYTTEMQKSIGDKAFFLDKIGGAKCIIDFGCADGSLAFLLAQIRPDLTIYGYDIDMNMIRLAKEHNQYNNIYFYHNSEITKMVNDIQKQFSDDEICINFSSVLHEVYSFNNGGISAIKFLVKKLSPKYITIRDMYFYQDITDYRVQFINDELLDTVINNVEWQALNEFSMKYGLIGTWDNLTHFLMKYQWINNGWPEELEENYYSWNINKFLETIESKYNVIYQHNYILPYLRNKWAEEYNIKDTCNACTHAQFVLERE